MGWIYLFVAGLFEILWAIALKYSHGFSRWIPSLISILGMIGSVTFLSFSLKSLSLGTAYSIWTGIGAIGTVVLGMILLGEARDVWRLVFLSSILIGIIGLKLTS